MFLRFAAPVFLGAFLLFLVQPLLGKFVVPRFGGGAPVWLVCLLFFQVALLVGYAYAHGLRRLVPRAHPWWHGGLLALSLGSLPIVPGGMESSSATGPTTAIFLLLTVTVGLPYVLLASTGPLLQSWFADARPSSSPYRLYALSNAGSLLALFGFPFLIEPTVGRQLQAVAWSWAYVAFVAVAGFATFEAGRVLALRPAGTAPRSSASERPGAGQLLLWLGLAAAAAAMLMAVTALLTQEVAGMPFLWVLPLGLYLLSFILCFDSDRWSQRRVWALGFAVCTPLGLWAFRQGLDLPFRYQVVVLATLLFTACLSCHGELARSRPAPASLTVFYLAVAAGGAIGGGLVSVVAPLVLTGYWEAYGVLLGCWLLLAFCYQRGERRARLSRPLAVGLPALASLAVVVMLVDQVTTFRDEAVYMGRSFYGVLRVTEEAEGDRLRTLHHGQIRHGKQFGTALRRRAATAYYGQNSGVGLAIRYHPRRGSGSMQIGVVGLGVGTLATYGRQGDRVLFYEIDELVEWVAREHFTYLADSRAVVEVVLGDARVRMREQVADGEAGIYDVLAIDAFSSDAIPVHLLTLESVELYWRLLRDDGILALHVSNRVLDLEPVVRGLARHSGATVTWVESPESRSRGTEYANWLLLTRGASDFATHPEVLERAQPWDTEGPVVRWTDDFASLWAVLDLD